MNTPTPTPTPRTDAATYPADCLGKTLVTNRDCPCALERELTILTAERDQLRAENATLRAAQKACEACDEPTAFEVRQLRDQLAAAQQREAIAIASWDEERNRALREGARVVEWRDRAERAEAAETVALANWNGALERAMKAEAELATERARRDDLVADINDACITLASAKDDCDDYALLHTGFKLTAVRDVLLQYSPNAAMKEGAK